MRIFFLMTALLTILTNVFGQDARKFYEQGLEKAQAGQLNEAITLFSRSIALQPEDYYSWYNRGIAKGMLKQYEEALTDFEQVVKLAPDYKKGWLNRGTTKKRLTDYTGAIADFSHAIKLDENYADAYYNRGLVYDMLSKKDSACSDFAKAKDLGVKDAQRKVDNCNDTTSDIIPTYSILRLTKTADDKNYGFTKENPVKVGTGPDGGPTNQRAYLDLLRDAEGKPLKYKRIASCCPYESKNGLMGMAMLDQYEITYLNEKGKEEKAIVYISFYDYEDPKILYGFKTVGQK